MKYYIFISLLFVTGTASGLKLSDKDVVLLIRDSSIAEIEESFKKDIPPNFSLQSGMPLLELAIIYDRTDVVALLLSKGAPPDPDGLNRVMHHACANQRVEAIKLLVKYGADINKAFLNSENQQFCLHEAVIHNNPEFFAFLLEFGADKNNEDNKGQTAADINNNILSKQHLIQQRLKSNN